MGSAPLDLSPLLTALREAGLAPGVRELARLRHCLALGPQRADGDGGERLRGLLRAVLVHRVEDRATFDRLFDEWLQQAEARVAALAPAPAEQAPVASVTPGHTEGRGAPRPQPPSPPHSRRWLRAFAVALLVGAVVGLGPKVDPLPAAPEPPPPPAPAAAEPLPPATVTPEQFRHSTFTSPYPELKVIPAPSQWQGWPWLALALLAGLGAGLAWRLLRERVTLPAAAPAPVRGGAPRLPLPAPGAVPGLLDERAAETLVWGIDRFVGEQPTPRLDLRASVRATAAAAGLATPVFLATRCHREVWLWLDDAARAPELRRLADEVEAALRAHNLPVERAWFRGLPDELVDARGRRFQPHELDERRDAALVAILTDGQRIRRLMDAPARRRGLLALLRRLAHWPRLAFVDCGPPGQPAADRLAPLLRATRLGLDCIGPAQLAAWLGGIPVTPTVERGPARPPPGLGLWAAACALAPAPIDAAHALALAERLGLGLSAWALPWLRADAGGDGARLEWRGPARRDHLRWLALLEGEPRRGIPPGGLLDRALAFWEERYQALAEGQAGAARESTARQRLHLDQALVRLWREPGPALRTLYPLHQGAWRAVIEEALRPLQAADLAGRDHVPLPWCRGQLGPRERAMARAMNLGGAAHTPLNLRHPGRRHFGLALAGGGAAAALLLALTSGSRPPGGPVVVEESGQPPPRARIETAPRPTVTTPDWQVAAADPLPPAGRLLVRWTPRTAPCVETRPGAEVWRCAAPLAEPGTGHRRIVLAAAPDTPGVADLAARLLTAGNADQVLVDPAWPAGAGHLPPPAPDDHLLVLAVGAAPPAGPGHALTLPAWPEAAAALAFTGLRPVAAVWPQAVPAPGTDPATLRLAGLGTACRPSEETDPATGMAFVRLCPGSFRMGSPEDEPGRRSDEGPVHTVTLSAFAIGRTEVTNAQYRWLHPDHEPGKPHDLPVVNVSWHEAKDFCERLGYHLPTEAQWEYTARAGTSTRWSFGDDEAELEKYAWYGEDWSESNAHPVGQKLPNPWGLYDMHGNAWEWTADGYGRYDDEAVEDPMGPAEGTSRVLRGGAFSTEARVLRSAFRLWVHPEFSRRNVGFRCVRSARAADTAPSAN